MTVKKTLDDAFRCRECGKTNDECIRILRDPNSGKSACCSSCNYIEIHNRPPLKLLAEMSGAELLQLYERVTGVHSTPEEPEMKTTADPDEVVARAAQILSDRADKYDNASLAVPVKMAELMSAYFGRTFTAEDACHVMVLHKLARAAVDPDDVDHPVDAAAYLSLAWKARCDGK